jgi:AcrR family transcriptional regulator
MMVAYTKFSEDRILDTAEEVIAAAGVDAASIAAIARAVGAPNGSIYHRFPTRKHLLGALWVRIATSYRATLSAALSAASGDLAETVVMHTFTWVHDNPSRAELLMRFRTEDFVPGDWPLAITDRIRTTNNALATDLLNLALQLGLNPLDVTLAVIDIPAAAARRSMLLADPLATAHIQLRAIELSRILLSVPTTT